MTTSDSLLVLDLQNVLSLPHTLLLILLSMSLRKQANKEQEEWNLALRLVSNDNRLFMTASHTWLTMWSWKISEALWSIEGEK